MDPRELPTVTVAELPAGELPAGTVLLDVREDEEWAAGHVEGAVHVPMHSVPAHLQYEAGPLTPDARIVVTCKAGGRSAQVTAFLLHHGYDAVNLAGGMLAWAAADRPMVADGDAAPTVL